MTQQRISAYEKGKREPDLETIKLFSEYFNVSIDYLLNKSEIKNPNISDEYYQTLGITKEKYINLSPEAKKQIKSFIKFLEKEENK